MFELLDETIIYLLFYKRPLETSVWKVAGIVKNCMLGGFVDFALDIRRDPQFLLSYIACLLKGNISMHFLGKLKALTVCLSHHPSSTGEKESHFAESWVRE